MRRGISRKMLAGFAGVTVVAGGIAFAASALATPTPTTSVSTEPEFRSGDDLPNPLAEARRAAREAAIAGVLAGELQPVQNGASTVVDLGAGSDSANGDGDRRGRPGHNSRTQYVELARETTDQIFVILAEFGDQIHPQIPPDPNAQRTTGPLHNEIPEPNRSVDNSTVWQADYSQEYFQDLYFGGGESLKNYYEAQSSGRYSVDGEVTDWVKVQYTQSRYGTDRCGSNVCGTVRNLVQDSANVWYANQVAAGRTAAEINEELARFDVWDRYDYDLDGDFNEPDGFLDHFQVVHAGGDQADGDPIYASDAIWSHRAYANLAFSPTCFPDGSCLTGTRIGTSNFWIGDYTMQPENGGRSVFYHEYAHDLDLPDDYNNQLGGDNNNEHWTLMAQSRLGAANDGGIGERGGDLGAWNKLQLGWLDYEVVNYDQHKTIQLGPQEYNSNLPQGIVVVLPEKEVTFDLGAPFSGDKQWYSGHRDNNQTFSLSRSVTVPAAASLTFQTRYDIELGFDWAEVAVNGTTIPGTINGVPTPNLGGYYWDGESADWVPAVFDLSAFAGQTVNLSIVYHTDPAVGGNGDLPDGLFVDDAAIGGVALSEDGWSTTGDWELVGASKVQLFPHFYIAGHRSYTSYDQYLKTGPYYFGYGAAAPDKVDHYAYQEGLLISYWDTSYADNDTMLHPGSGRNLYIDAHPQPFARANGDLWRARIQVYDAPFGKTRTDQVQLHHNGQLETFGGLPGNSVFRDTDQYWFAELPNHGVKLPGYGVQIRVLNTGGGKMQVKVN